LVSQNDTNNSNDASTKGLIQYFKNIRNPS